MALASTASALLRPAADLARAIHLSRQIEAATEHGAARLAALGLPRIVAPDFTPLDPVAVGDALDVAISTLDALDAPDEDKEPWLVRPCDIGHTGPTALFDGDDDEGAALERHGRGFVQAGEDDAEDAGGEPYLSVVECDGYADKWGRSGQPTLAGQTDVEEVSDDGRSQAGWLLGELDVPPVMRGMMEGRSAPDGGGPCLTAAASFAGSPACR